jgi:uncharacterized Zn finger protein
MTDAPQVPYSLYVVCPRCGEETLHKVLKGKVHTRGREVTVEATVECSECSRVHLARVSETKPMQVPAVISWKDSSKRTTIEMQPDDAVAVGDVIQHEVPLLVTAVETKVRREARAKARDIVCIWAKRFDRVIVKFSVNRGMKATPFEVEASPDDLFTVKERLELERGPVVITSIKTAKGLMDSGSAAACDIVRVYARPYREFTRAYREPPQQRRPGRRPQGRTQSRPGQRGFRRARR